MPEINLPAYAIVELLIRLADLNENIGDYKGHVLRNGQVMVKTTAGSIVFTTGIVLRQFESPERITTDDLAQVAALFKPEN